MDATANVAFSLVHNFVDEAPVQPVIRNGIIRVDLRSVLDLLEHFGLQGFPLHVRNYLRTNLAEIAVKDSHDSGLAAVSSDAATLHETNPLLAVHILGLPANESLINFDFGIRATKLQRQPRPFRVPAFQDESGEA